MGTLKVDNLQKRDGTALITDGVAQTNLLSETKPDLFICGHSHICKIQMDKKLNMLYMNPGAAGINGFHKVRTLIRFSIEGKKIYDCEVIELGNRVKSS